jgi:hypothetical protein
MNKKGVKCRSEYKNKKENKWESELAVAYFSVIPCQRKTKYYALEEANAMGF